ncbi:MAG: OmpA family protein, partial [Bacteroidota bacterium]
PDQVISGVVKDINTQKILPGAIVVLLDESGNELQSVVSNKDDASFSFDRPSNNSYKIVVSAEGYLNEEIELKSLNGLEDQPLVEISMSSPPDGSIIVDKKNTINISTIYFNFNKYNIRSDAEYELDRIVEVMKEYPDITIDVGSHTDSRGKNSYNINLSNKRANSTIQYLVKKGIAFDRISGNGFGEEQLAENCPNGIICSEFQHQLNRRSQFLFANTPKNITIKSNNKSNSGDFDSRESLANSGAFINYNFDFDNNTVVYTVQIGAYRKNVQSNKYDKLTNLFNHRYNDGLNRYFAGKFKTSDEARSYAKLLKKRGFEGAFLVGLKGNNRFYKFN